MKWLVYLLLFIGLVFGWAKFANNREGETLRQQLVRINDAGEEGEDLEKAKTALQSHENSRLIQCILLGVVTAVVVGVIFVVDVLPVMADKMTHAVYDSAEMVEQDAMHDARAKVAQGDYEGAIEAFKTAAQADPLNRMPWVEIAKIYRENLENPAAALGTLRTALEGQEWQVNDAAYLMFRVAELYDEDLRDRASATTILLQVTEQFPNTRHSANARHRLHEWGVI
ncbi:MAG TPA: tetratricopeptide repeat protein [Luteolibacter sp.]